MSRISWWGGPRARVVRLRVLRGMSVVASGAVAAQLALAGPAMAVSASSSTRPAAVPVSVGKSVPVTAVAAKKIVVKDGTKTPFKATHVSWPAAGSGTVALADPAVRAGAAGVKTAAASTPVWVQAVANSHGAYAGPSAAQVKVLSHSAASALGVSGVVLTVSGSSVSAGLVRVGLDYGGFAQEYGGNFGSRLALVELPACALTTPQIADCRKQTPVASSSNDAVAQSVSAQVALGGSRVAAPQLVLAATSGADTEGDAAGSYAATSLKPSGSWSQGGDTGSFDYSYPITLPGASSSLIPSVPLSYDSGSVDGQTATTQTQSSWVGDGWDTTDSFVEQTFTSCSDSPEGVSLPSSESTADECYDGPILTVSLDGSSSSLVCNAAETQCTEQSDDGATVSHVTGSGNGSGTYNTDYWVITERDGTKYYFGLNRLPGYASGDAATHSVDSEPVYSANLGDPCYSSSGFTSSVCTMAYRWHLDYVTNLSESGTGQAMAYYYTQSSNFYGQDNGAKEVSYIRDSYLSEIDYGFNAGGAYGTVPDKVLFTPNANGRCVLASCTPLSSSSMTATLAGTQYPDVPFDLICASGTTCTSYAPSFFSTARLASITTEQYSTSASAYEDVDSYVLTQTEPETGDTTNSTLWLAGIQHFGEDTSAGGSAAAIPMPSMSFGGIDLANRVDTASFPALDRYRINSITSELGSVTSVTYGNPDPCSDAYVTAQTASTASSNTNSCYPVYWTPPGYSAQIMDWFESYAVTRVIVSDSTGGALPEETDYSYGGGAAWHYDDNEVVKAKYRTYGQFRGYSTVTTYTGQLADNPQAEQVDTYYQGMDGDYLSPTTTRSITLHDSQGGAHTDSDALAGSVLESRQYLGSGGPLETDTITSYWVSGAVQTRTRTGLPSLTAQWAGVAETWKSQADTDGGETGVSTVTETDTTYDATTTDANFGLVEYAYSHSVPVNAAYDSCAGTQYAAANTSLNLVGLADLAETDSVACSGFTEGSVSSAPSAFNTLGAPSSVSRPAQVKSAVETFYDDPTFSTTFPQSSAPSVGDVTMTRKASGYSGSAFTWQTETQDTYDAYGRVLDAYDADGNETVTTYTVNAVGLTTAQSDVLPTVNHVAHVASETFDPTRGVMLTSTDANGVVTTEQYDALGRLTSVWEDSRTTSQSANLIYTYTVSDSSVSGVTTQTLNDEGGYNTSVTIDDSLGRTRQTQMPTPQGGRLITDTFYDSHGWVYKTNTDYWDSTTTPTMALVAVADNQVADQTDTVFDGLGRAVQVMTEDDAAVKSTATTVYNGDSTTVIPPTGGTVKTTVTDPLGRTTKLIEYTANPTLTTPANTFTGLWYITGGTPTTTTYGFDGHGNQDSTSDDSSGTPGTSADDTWTSTYNLLGQETATTDPDAGAGQMVYDADGNLLQSKDADGNYVSYTYDALGRKTYEYAAPDVAADQTSATELASWGYDNANDSVPGMLYAIGQTTTQTSYSGGNAYTEQSLGFNVFGESLGTEVVIPSAQGTALGKTWTFHD
jgi:YD repeat-containing protein